MSDFANTIQNKFGPLMTKLGDNVILNSITRGFMASLPLTLGTFLIALVGNFPIPAWTEFLSTSGLNVHFDAVIGATTDLLGLYFAFTIAYFYAKNKGSDEIVAGVLSLATFLILIPQKIAGPNDTVIGAFEKTYLGSQGIFIAMIMAILVASLYTFLHHKGLVIKVPDSVPEMVSRSLSPVFISIIIFVVAFLIRVGFAYTSYETIFGFVNTIITKPVMSLGSSPVALITFFTISNLLWWCGIHPASLQGVYLPVASGAIGANVAAYLAGEPVPYLAFMILFFTYVGVGGNGNTLGLALNMALFGKSQRFKSLAKLALIPNIFNINEPLIFGVPMIFNLFFIVPMVFSSIVTGLIGLLFIKMGAYDAFNPLVQLPWTTPPAVTALMTAGFMAALGVIVAILASMVLYYPFFKMADNYACAQEMENDTDQSNGELQSDKIGEAGK